MGRSAKLKSAIVDLRQHLKSKKVKNSKKSNKSSGCHYCNGPHKIRHCEKLLKFSIVERRKEIAKLNLCANCLMPVFGKHNCKAGPCRNCGGFEFHNSILCFMAVR